MPGQNHPHNNSDDEDFVLNDFISFPVLPDPEADGNRTLTQLFTNTLRKVTNNASTLVHTYSSPKSRNVSSVHPDALYKSLGNDLTAKLEEVANSDAHSKLASLQPSITDNLTTASQDLNQLEPLEVSNANSISLSGGNHSQTITALDMSDSPPLRRPIMPSQSQSVPVRIPSPLPGNDQRAMSEQSELAIENPEILRQILPIAPLAATVSVSTPAFTTPPPPPPPAPPLPTVMTTSTSTLPPAMSLPPLEPVSTSSSQSSSILHPRVTSDNKGLRIGTSFSRIPATTAASTTSINVLSSKDRPTRPVPRSPFHKQPKVTRSKSKKTLQNRISSLFTNLPNDIELSDDSASDTESIANDTVDSDYITPITSASFAENKLQPTITNSYSSLYSSTTIEPSRVKAERLLNDSIDLLSPSLSSFYALREKDLSRQKKTSGGNLSSAIIDNAKSIIANSNLVSSASSVINSKTKGKKKKPMPKKTSQNPLKTGGIPRKYWMNDAFVSDCLNCFKPFSAFRRKHHCRFCGQIFCSECTLFISYNQHKAQRRENGNSDEIKKFSDKLRVCKPCYDDVIIYLSDDSSSSSEEEDVNDLSKEDEPTTPIDDAFLNVALNVHVRSQSVNSRNDGLLHANKSFLNKDTSDTKSIITSPSLRERKYASPNPEMGTPTALRQTNTALEKPKALPIMAIPTTRTGQAVEIPVTQSHLANFSGLPYSKSSTYMTSLESTPIRDSLPSKGWFKNYTRTRNASTPDLSAHSNFEGIGQFYHNLRSKGPNGSKYRVYSGSERDLISKQSSSIGDDESDSSGKEDDDERVSESENEDEQAMSMYTSLNHIAHNNNDPVSAVIANSATVVPTLGEFPTMIVNEKLFGKRFGKVQTPKFSSNEDEAALQKAPNVTFLEDRQPRTGESLRSHERAHKSLLRMRSRRKSKSVRNTLVFSPNIFKAPVNTLPDHNLSRNRMSLVLTTSSPVSSTPVSPRSNSNMNLPDVNLSKVLSQEAFSAPGSPTTNNPYHDLYDRTTSSLQMAPNDSLLESPRHPLASRTSNNHIARLKLNSSEVSFSDTDAIDCQDGLLNISFEGITMNSMRENLKSKNVLYKDYLDLILLQCFDDCDIKDDIERWRVTLNKVLGAIENLKLTDTLDFKQYVKVKKILGGSIEQTSVIDGLFMTKDIDSRGMSSKITDPKIALLMFPIEYLKQKELFISLRIIKAQQQVYITNLVSRLISLEPDIIMVGDLVCGLALKLLEEANITVISNTKPQVIERMSRYTKADIFQTVNDLFFKKGSLGTCKQFEIKKYYYEGIIKTLSFFTGNDMSTGFTIALRGGDEDLLASIKYAVETVMMGELNSKLERKWLDDQQMMIYSDEQDEKVVHVTRQINEIIDEMDQESQVGLSVCDISPESHEIKNYIDLFNKRKVSVSPVVKFTLPPVLVHIYHAFVSYYEYFKTNREVQKLTDASQIENHWLAQLKLTFIDNTAQNLPNKGVELLDILKFASQRHLNDLKAAYNIRARNWTNSMNSTSYQLYPVFHKNIYVLHSTISLKYSTPCDGPNLVVVDYYSDNDKCFGLFLDQIFHDAKNGCDECGELLLNHCKSYCHGNGKLDFLIEMQSSVTQSSASSSSGVPGAGASIPNNRRVMWSFCSECNHTTPLSYMSNETYYLSIGKFFELNFWGHNVISSDYQHSGCGHDFFKKYVKCFAMNDMIIKMQYSHLDTYEIVVPNKQVALKSEIDIRLRLESYEFIRKKAEVFFRSILDRLEIIKKNEAIDNLEKALARATILVGQANGQAEEVHNQLMDIYNGTGHTSYMSLNIVLRKLQELGFEWNNIFNEFEKEFVPTENDLAKFTQFHIKNFLMDKYNSIDDEQIAKKVDAEKEKPTENPACEDISRSKETEESNVPEICTDPSFDTSHASISSIAHATPMTPSAQSSSSLNPIIIPTPRTKSLLKAMGERINHMEQLLKEGDSSPLLVLTPSRRDGDGSSLVAQNRVYELASYFDQMNFDEISQELKKLEKLNFKPIPVGESRPIVEIYNKIEDAVNVDKGDTGTNADLNADEVQKAKSKSLRIKKPLNNNQSPFNFTEHMRSKFPRRVSNVIHHPQPISPIPEGNSSKSISPNNLNTKSENASMMLVPSAAETTSEGALVSTNGTTLQDTGVSNLSVTPQTTIPTNVTSQPQEKQSILKLLTKFWVERASTMWGDQQLEFVLDSTEHTFADSEVIVREDEPSSLIALCLSSSDYRLKMQQMKQNVEGETQREGSGSADQGASTNGPSNPSGATVGANATATSSSGKTGAVGIISGADSTALPIGINKGQSSMGINAQDKKSVNFAKIEKKFKRRTQLNGGCEELELVLNRQQLNHLKYQFVDGQTHFSCKIFYSEHFEAMRWACGNHETFIQSLSRCVKWKSNGGKSGSNFLKTLDDRYIIKELSKSELELFVMIAPYYFKYIAQSTYNTLTTAIAKIFGFYQIEIRNNDTNKVLFKMDFLIMENLFYNHKLTRIFDLKGSMRNRHVKQTGRENEVLLDENMIEYIYESPVCVKELLKRLMRGALFNDTSFLSAMDVMDYSLVVGIDDTSNKLYIGIIDWLRTFTWDKKVENWVKGNNLMGSKKRGKDPTIVTPKQYRNRFREAMERYILEIPDPWYLST